MKKSTKILTLIIGLVAMVGILTVAVVASSTPTPWAPTEGDGVFYAVWSSEDSYLAGDEPTVTNLTDGADNEEDKKILSEHFRGWGSCYVRIYDDVGLQGYFYDETKNENSNGGTLINVGTSAYIELNGHTLTVVDSVLKVGAYSATNTDTSLTFAHGKFSIGKQSQINRSASLIFDEVELNTTRELGFDSGGKIYFYNSVWNNSYSFLFDLGTSNKTGEISFNNTDIISTGTINPAKGLFYIRNGSANNAFKITFDADSSLSTVTENPVWAYTTGNAAVSTIYLERGFTMSESVVKADAGVATLATSDAAYSSVKVVEPDTTTLLSSYMFKDNGDGTVSIAIPDWAWALYTEGSSLPVLSSATPTVTNEQIRESGATYLKLYMDTALTVVDDGALIPDVDSFLIELDSFALGADGALNLMADGQGTALTVTGGTVTADGDVSFGSGNSASFTGATLNASSLRSASPLDFASSTLNLSGSVPVVLGAYSGESAALTLTGTTLNATSDAISAGASATTHLTNNAVITVVYDDATLGSAWSIALDGDSSVILPNDTEGAVFLSLAATVTVDDGAYPTLAVEENFGFSSTTDPRRMTSTTDGISYTDTAPVTLSVLAAGTGTALDSYVLASKGEGISTFGVITWEAYASKDAYLADDDPIYTNLSFAPYDYDGDGVNDSFLDAANLKTFGNAYVVLYDDLQIASLVWNSNILPTNSTVTFELNGKTVTFPTQTCFGSYGGAENATVIFENGKVVFKHRQTQVNTTTTVIFKSVELTTNAGFGYDSGGKVEIYDSTWTHQGNTTDTNLTALFWGGNTVKTGWVGGLAVYNTDITIAGAFTGTKAALLSVSNSGRARASYVLSFDSESSLNYHYDGLTWIYVADTATTDNKQNIYIEPGFKVNGQAIGKADAASDAAGFTTNGGNTAVTVVTDITNPVPSPYIFTEVEGETGIYTVEIPDWAWGIFENPTDLMPKISSFDATITDEVIRSSGYTYLKIYKDTVITASGTGAILPDVDSFIIDLGTCTLTAAGDLNLMADGQGTALTVKGGTLTAGGTVSFGRGNSATLSGVTVNAASVKTASPVTFSKSALTLSGGTPIVLEGYEPTLDGAAFNLDDVDLTLTSSAIATSASDATSANSAIVTLKYTDATLGAAWTVRLDTATTVSAPNMTAQAVWLAIVADSALPEGVAPAIYFEENILFTELVAPNENYVTRPVGSSAFVEKTDAAAATASVSIVAPGSTTPLEGWIKVAVGDGYFTVGLIKWAVYESEDAYKAGAPYLKSNFDYPGGAQDLTSAEFKALGSCYIRLYADMMLGDDAITMNKNTSVVFELNGNTLTVPKKFRVGGYGTTANNSHLTVKNGSIVTGSEWQVNGADSSLTAVKVNWTASAQLGYQSGGAFIFTDSTLTSEANFVFGVGYNDSTVRLSGTTVNVKSGAALIKSFDHTTSIYIDKSCVINSAGNGRLTIENTANGSQKPLIYFEVGATVDGDFMTSDGALTVCTGTVVTVVDPETSIAVPAYVFSDNGDGTFSVYVPNWSWAIYESLSSASPILTGDTTTLTNLDIRNAGGTVLKLFKNVTVTLADGANTAGNDYLLPATSSFTVVTNGMTITVDGDLILMADGAGTALTVTDGVLNVTGTLSFGRGNSATLSGVTVNAASVKTASPVTLDGCTVTLSADMPIVLEGYAAELDRADFTLVDTELTLTSSAIATSASDATLANSAIVTLKYTDATLGAAWTVRFDTDSTVAARNMTAPAVWLAIVADAALPEGTLPALYFEENFSFTANAAPNFNYLTRPVGSEGFVEKTDAAAVGATVLVVKKGTADEALGWVLVAKSGEWHTVGLIQWAVYESEDAYKAGAPAIATNYTDGYDDEEAKLIRAEFINTLGDCYIVLYTDVGFTSYPVDSNTSINLGTSGQDIVIELNGYTLTNKSTMKLGAYGTWYNCSLTVKNGAWNLSSHQSQFQEGATLRIVNVDVSASNSFGYGSGADMYFTDSTVTLGSNVPFSLGTNKDTQIVSFVNTDVILTSAAIGTPNGNKVAGIFGYHQAWNGWTATAEIRLDKDSSISAAAGSLLLGLYEAKGTVDSLTLYIEEGCSLSEGLLFDMTPEAYDYNEDAYFDVFDKAYVKIVEAGETESPESAELYGKYTGVSDLVQLLMTRPVDDIAWYVELRDFDIIFAVPVKNADGITEAVITPEELLALREGSVLILAADVRLLADRGTVISSLANGLTFDLGGHKLYFDGTFDLSGDGDRIYTVKNGEMSSTSDVALFSGDLGADGLLTLERLKITFTGAPDMITLLSGSLKIADTAVDYDGTGSVINMNSPLGVYKSLSLDRVPGDSANKLLSLSVNSSTDFEYTVSNCRINAVYVIDVIRGGNDDLTFPTAENSLAITVSNSYIRGELVTVDGAIDFPVNVTLSETYLVSAPSYSGVGYAKGEKLMLLTDDNLEYLYHVTKLDTTIRNNLVLSSDFTVRFYIPVNTNISEIKIGNTVYTVSELTEKINIFPYGEHYVITFAVVSPAEAAELIEYTLTFTKDGYTHVADTAYSVLDYVSSVLDSDLNWRVKQLAVSATEYIAAAYAYANRSSDDLTALRASELYIVNLPELWEALADDTDMTPAEGAISGVQLNLGADMKMRFNLKSTYSGTLVIAGVTYEVIGGVAAGHDYVELALPAHTMYDSVIEISVDGTPATYSLASYAYATAENGNLTETERALVSALYSYCYYADVYENTND